MTLKVTRLYTHWDAAEAHTVIAFLDELRERLWEIYGDQVVQMLREASSGSAVDERQILLDFDDEINF